MKHHLLIPVLICLTLPLSAQKSKVLAVRQMIDAEKFNEAKEAIEQAVENPRTSNWARTYYTKGLLCQNAYKKGMEKNDSKLIGLYEDQLYLAYNSFEKALELDGRERLHSHIRQNYYLLANEFRSLGEKLYNKKDYKDALRAFEYAILIGENDLITAKMDTNLLYNTAMTAFEGQDWGKAVKYLTVLHDNSYSPSTSLLLSKAYMNHGDTLQSEEIMMQSLEQYEYRDTLVMFVVNHHVRAGNMETAIRVLDQSIEAIPENYRFLWARALVYEELNQYEAAISSFLQAAELSEDKYELFYHLGVCYYNVGIDLRENALKIREEVAYRKAREAYLEKFREAVTWFERSYDLNPNNEKTITRLHQLYNQLQMKEEQKSLEQREG